MKKKASKQTGKQAGNEVQEVIAMSFEEFTRDTVRRAAWAIMVEEKKNARQTVLAWLAISINFHHHENRPNHWISCLALCS